MRKLVKLVARAYYEDEVRNVSAQQFICVDVKWSEIRRDAPSVISAAILYNVAPPGFMSGDLCCGDG